MHRQNCIWGWILIAFGLGLLAGTWLQSGFLICCLGIGSIGLGICVIQKK